MRREKRGKCRDDRSQPSRSPYIRVRTGDGGREYLHRLIFEKTHRPLEAGEIVHHKNENKRDNSPENLEVKADAAEHLAEHNHWRHRRRQRRYDSTPIDIEAGF